MLDVSIIIAPTTLYLIFPKYIYLFDGKWNNFSVASYTIPCFSFKREIKSLRTTRNLLISLQKIQTPTVFDWNLFTICTLWGYFRKILAQEFHNRKWLPLDMVSVLDCDKNELTCFFSISCIIPPVHWYSRYWIWLIFWIITLSIFNFTWSSAINNIHVYNR